MNLGLVVIIVGLAFYTFLIWYLRPKAESGGEGETEDSSGPETRYKEEIRTVATAMGYAIIGYPLLMLLMLAALLIIFGKDLFPM